MSPCYSPWGVGICPHVTHPGEWGYVPMLLTLGSGDMSPCYSPWGVGICPHVTHPGEWGYVPMLLTLGSGDMFPCYSPWGVGICPHVTHSGEWGYVPMLLTLGSGDMSPCFDRLTLKTLGSFFHSSLRSVGGYVLLKDICRLNQPEWSWDKQYKVPCPRTQHSVSAGNRTRNFLFSYKSPLLQFPASDNRLSITRRIGIQICLTSSACIKFALLLISAVVRSEQGL